MILSGYVLEPVRLGGSTSAFTAGPDSYIYHQGMFDGWFPADESEARAEWLITCTQEGKLHEATWGWSLNQGALVDGKQIPFQRFDYDGIAGQFKLLPGGSLVVIGSVGPTANTTRLVLDPKPVLWDLTSWPVRISVGSGSGVTLTIQVVPTDADLNNPDPTIGHCQVSQESGALGWCPADLVTYNGQPVRFQQQGFRTLDDQGLLGLAGETLLLAPKPLVSQKPQIRLGYGQVLTPVVKSDDSFFSADPAVGTVEWSLATGRIKLNSAVPADQAVFYEGTLLGTAQITGTAQGTVTSPTALTPVPIEGDELYFRSSGGVQWPVTQWVDAFGDGSSGTVQVRRSDGAIQFATDDVAAYGVQTVTAWHGLLPLSKGVGIRVWRSLADPGGSLVTVKDATQTVSRVDPDCATWADPIAESPYVRLPILPLEGPTLTVKVEQGTGSWVGDLPNQITTPTAGVGYSFDYPNRRLQFCRHLVDRQITMLEPQGSVQLDPLLIGTTAVSMETYPGSGTYQTLTGADYLMEPNSGLVTFIRHPGEVLLSGTGTLVGQTLTGTGFTSGMLGGSVLVSGEIATVVAQTSTTLTLDCTLSTSGQVLFEVRAPEEVLADRYWLTVPAVDPSFQVVRKRPMGVAANGALAIPYSRLVGSAMLVGGTARMLVEYGTLPGPGAVPAGTVAVLTGTGELEFRTSDLGLEVTWLLSLTFGKDYTVQPELGSIALAERLLSLDEAEITYVPKGGTSTVERARFGVRKETSQPHPAPTSAVQFNPTGKEVAAVTRVYRGGRPQSASQVSSDLATSTITFVGERTVTDALPSGATIGPSERIMVDYQVYQAMGGEASIQVQHGPIQTAPVVLTSGESQFTVPGDQRALFQPACSLRVNGQEVHLLASSTLDGDTTVVQLASGESFEQDYQAPRLEVSSGPLPLLSYWAQVLKYDPLPKGSNQLMLPGNQVAQCPAGTLFRVWTGTLAEYLQVEGAAYIQDQDATKVTLAWGPLQECRQQVLYRTIRPILSAASTSAATKLSPVDGQEFVCFRKVSGQPGRVLSAPTDYKADPSGQVTLASPLQQNESLGVWYCGHRIVGTGTSVRATYTNLITPSAENGLLGQVLKAAFTALAPDSFYFRVEPYSNFQAELEQQYAEQAAGQSPTAGPNTDNIPAPRLYEQGAKSTWFDEKHLHNEDVVGARALAIYHEAIEGLEDALQRLDGRVVGDLSGRFLYDGILDNPTRATWAAVTNQVDDTLKVSPAPYTVTGPPFALVSVGTYAKAYEASNYSRFYPLKRDGKAAIDRPSPAHNGDPMGFWGWAGLDRVEGVQKRYPYAMVTKYAALGDTVLHVDAIGSADELRPMLQSGMKVRLYSQAGVSGLYTISSITGTSVHVTPALTAAVTRGTTILLDATDPYVAAYQVGLDLGTDLKQGLVTYLSLPGSTAVPDGSILEASLGYNPTGTAPYRFPALDGITRDDSGFVASPMVGPSTASEAGGTQQVGVLGQEVDYTGATGLILSVTNPPNEVTATMSGSGLVVTVTSGSMAGLAIGDLVRITSGANQGGAFRMVEAILSGTQFQVEAAWPFQSGSFTISLGIGATLESGSATWSTSGSFLTMVDLTADYLTAGVKVGHTVVRTSAGVVSILSVVAVLDATSLTVTSVGGVGTGTYRLHNSLTTYLGADTFQGELSDLLAWHVDYLQGTGSGVRSEYLGAAHFLDTLLTTTLTGSTGTVSALGTQLVDISQDFYAADLAPLDYVYVATGSNLGIYRITSIVDAHTIQLEDSWPVSQTNMAYQVRRTNLAGKDSLVAAADFQRQAVVEAGSVQAFADLVNTMVPVQGRPTLALGWTYQDLTDWSAHALSRLTLLTGSNSPGKALEKALQAGDRFYDKRYVWIDSRINLETGTLVRQKRAAQDREKAQQESSKALLKLLALG